MHRSVDGPDQVFSTTDQAVAWLGVKETRFRQLVRLHPWLRPHNQGTSKRPRFLWHWMDLVSLAHVLQRDQAGAADLFLSEEGENEAS